MAITAANLKFFQATTWTEGVTHGGDISANEITTGVSQNIFDNTTDAERISGVTMYRKIFLKNLNADAYNGVKAWIQSNTPDTQTAVTIVAGGKMSLQGNDSSALTGGSTFVFAASTTVTATGSAFTSELRPGEKIFNSTNDTNAAAVAIASIESDTSLTLVGNYTGTTGASKAAKVAPITGSTFVTAVDEANGVVLGNLIQNAYRAVWIKLVVDASADGYTDDTFTIRVSNS